MGLPAPIVCDGGDEFELPDNVSPSDSGDDGGCDIDLPDDIVSDPEHSHAGAVPEASADTDLPADVTQMSVLAKKWHCTCKRDCMSAVPADVVERLRSATVDKDAPAKKKHQFDTVRRELLSNTVDGCPLPGQKSESGAAGQPRVRYEFKVEGTQVCLKFFLHCHAISNNRYNDIKKLVVSGHGEEPEHAARIPSISWNKQWNAADAWFLMVYKEIAEPFAETFNESEIAGGHSC